LNLNISASRQDIKNLVGKFLAINMMIIPAKFQPSSSTGMGGKWSLYKKYEPYNENSKFPPSLRSGGIIYI